MPITFDTLDELKAFYRSFHLQEKNGASVLAPGKSSNGKRGRKPGTKSAAKTAVKPGAKRGPKPKKVTTVKASAKKAAARPAARKIPQGDTLTSKIRETIRKFLNEKRSFTANDVYDDLSKRDNTVNKQSVITSVLKQMNSTFKTVAVTERPGNGPRAVKLYNP